VARVLSAVAQPAGAPYVPAELARRLPAIGPFRKDRSADVNELLMKLLDRMGERQAEVSAGVAAETGTAASGATEAARDASDSADASGATVGAAVGDEGPPLAPQLPSLFQGQLRFCTKCIRCGAESDKCEAFVTLPLSIPSNAKSVYRHAIYQNYSAVKMVVCFYGTSLLIQQNPLPPSGSRQGLVK